MREKELNPHQLIRTLNLKPHPEGGHYRQTYCSELTMDTTHSPTTSVGKRAVSTAIYYLLKGDETSFFHRIRSDEIWHHYLGGSLEIPVIAPDGQLSIHKLGKNFERGEEPQVRVPAGHWFGAKPEKPDAFTLAGCTVAPGFDFEDFQLAERAALLKAFPQHRQWIELLTSSTS